MANIEKFATPITNRNIVQPVSEHKSAEAERVDYQDTSRVKQTPSDSELLRQHNGDIHNQRGPAVFMNLLSDPQVTAGFMRNIYMMMDIVALIPIQNGAFTEEMQQLFSELYDPAQKHDNVGRAHDLHLIPALFQLRTGILDAC